MTRTWWVKSRFVAVVTAFSLVCAFGSVASAATTPQVTGKGTGPQPKGLGLGSAAALAQKTCTPNGRTSFNIVGGGPFCVNPWPKGKDNGGATAPGVTATEVKIVAYIPNDQMLAGGTGAAGPKNQATGADGEDPRHDRRLREAVRLRPGSAGDVSVVGTQAEHRDRHREWCR